MKNLYYKTKEDTFKYLKSENFKFLPFSQKLQVWLDAKEKRRLEKEYMENKLTIRLFINKLKRFFIRNYKLLRYGNRYYMGKPRFSETITEKNQLSEKLSDLLNSKK